MYISFSTEKGEGVIATMVMMLEDAQCDCGAWWRYCPSQFA